MPQPRSKVAYVSIHNQPLFPDDIRMNLPLAQCDYLSSPGKLGPASSPFVSPFSPLQSTLPTMPIHFLFAAAQIFISELLMLLASDPPFGYLALMSWYLSFY